MPASPPDVRAWSGLELVRPLTGGARNRSFLARRGELYYVVRTSRRLEDSLAWELDLLDALDEGGFAVPRAIATDDGRRHDEGVLLQPFCHGDPPRDQRDWQRVVTELRAIHACTADWAQRPGFASARQLLHQPAGGDVRLDWMPEDAVTVIRTSWQVVTGGRENVIHGDPGPGNIAITEQRVALIDWDEARVDSPAFDFAAMPSNIDVPVAAGRHAAYVAGLAWEAATCWTTEPDYAARRLAELRAKVGGPRDEPPSSGGD